MSPLDYGITRHWQALQRSSEDAASKALPERSDSAVITSQN